LLKQCGRPAASSVRSSFHGTTAARKLLEGLAAEARLTREAKASLDRLARQQR
jgi:hypothetical protein